MKTDRPFSGQRYVPLLRGAAFSFHCTVRFITHDAGMLTRPEAAEQKEKKTRQVRTWTQARIRAMIDG